MRSAMKAGMLRLLLLRTASIEQIRKRGLPPLVSTLINTKCHDCASISRTYL